MVAIAIVEKDKEVRSSSLLYPITVPWCHTTESRSSGSRRNLHADARAVGVHRLLVHQRRRAMAIARRVVARSWNLPPIFARRGIVVVMFSTFTNALVPPLSQGFVIDAISWVNIK